MGEVVTAAIAFPAIIFTGVLALALVYWIFVVVGALDLDLLGGAEADLDLGMDGAAKGALEGAVKGSLEGAVKGAAEGVAEGVADVDGDHSTLADIFAALQLNRAPATVVLTLIGIFGWLTSVLALMNLMPAWTSWGMPGWAFKLLVFIASLLVALPLTALAVRPFAPFFVTYAAKSKKELVGQVCVISTGRVDNRFGQAILPDGGAEHILDVRCDTPGLLRKGDRALLVSWDADREVFQVEAMDDLLTERRVEAAALRSEELSAGPPASPEAEAGEGANGRDPSPPEKAREHVG
jgi:hypothetical protein